MDLVVFLYGLDQSSPYKVAFGVELDQVSYFCTEKPLMKEMLLTSLCSFVSFRVRVVFHYHENMKLFKIGEYINGPLNLPKYFQFRHLQQGFNQ